MTYNEALFTRIRESVEVLTGERGDAAKSQAALRRRDLTQLQEAVAKQAGDNTSTEQAMRQVRIDIQQLQIGKLGTNSKAADSSKLDGYLPQEFVQTPHGIATGSPNAQVVTVSGYPMAQLNAGDQYRVRFGAVNTGAATIKVNEFLALPMVTVTGVALPAGYLRTDIYSVLTYDAAGFFWVDRPPDFGVGFTRHPDGRVDLSAILDVPSMAANADVTVAWPFGTFTTSPIISGTLNMPGNSDPPRIISAEASGGGGVFYLKNGATPQAAKIFAVGHARWY